ncbi:unnamed protein product [Alopecurus aequalis]
MPPPAPPLPDELLEEIFLRLPPDEPACLVRASLSSKFWLGLLSGPRFRGRYREHHGAPPVLGFFYSWAPYSSDSVEETTDALFFMLMCDDDGSVGILKYDLPSKCLSVIDAPLAKTHILDITILMGMGDGSLGFAHLDGLTLNIWSRQTRSDVVGLWTECRIIDLKEFLPIQNPENRLRLLGSVVIILVSTDLGVYEISLKSLEWKKIRKRANFRALVPYMTFYDPREKATPL